MTLEIGQLKLNNQAEKTKIAKSKADLVDITDPDKQKVAKEKIKKESDKFHAQAETKKAQIEKLEKELTDKIGKSKFLGRIHQKYKSEIEAKITQMKIANADILGLEPDKVKELKVKHKELKQSVTELEAGLKDETDSLKSETKEVDASKTKKIKPIIAKITGINKNIENLAKEIEDAGGEIEAEEKDSKDKEETKKKETSSKENGDDAENVKKSLNIFKKESLDESSSEKIDDLEKDLYKLLHKRQTLITSINSILDKDDDVKTSKKKEKEFLDKLKSVGGTVDTDVVKTEKKKSKDGEVMDSANQIIEKVEYNISNIRKLLTNSENIKNLYK